MSKAVTIGIISSKGGVGKTTVVANLGTVLAAEFKQKVIVVDANLDVPNLHLYLDMIHPPSSLPDVLSGDVSLDRAIYTTNTGLDVLPGSFKGESVDFSGFSEVIDVLRKRYDLILIDSHCSVDEDTASIMKVCDELLIVTNPWLPIVISNLPAKKLAGDVGAHITGIILNKVKRSELEMSPNEVSDSLDLPIIGEITADIKVYRGVEKRVPVVAEVPDSDASKKLRGLAETIVEEIMGGSSLGHKKTRDLEAEFLKLFKYYKKQGKSPTYSEIGNIMNISPDTVEKIVENLKAKQV
jgi:MinD-like ATPase involved in chromosome partitioning or flagellar assembly